MRLSDGTTVVLSTANSDEAMEAIVRGRGTVTGGILTLTDGDRPPLLLLLPNDTRAVPGDPAGVSIRGRTIRTGQFVRGSGGGVSRPSSLLPDELPQPAAEWLIVALSSIDIE